MKIKRVLHIILDNAVHYSEDADKTILLIDDDDSILLVHRYGMQKSGYRVIEAENGYIGMDMFEKYKDEIDIIIVDLMMPGFNGVEVINDIMNKYPEHNMLKSYHSCIPERLREIICEKLANSKIINASKYCISRLELRILSKL